MNEGARKPVVCFDGFEFSVQAGKNVYSLPQQYLHRMGTREGQNTWPDDYAAVEVGFPSQKEPLLMPYSALSNPAYEDYIVEDWNPDGEGWDTIYPYVPVDVVYEVIMKHGGLASPQDTLPPMDGIITYPDDKTKWPSMFAPEVETDTFRLARITMAEQLHAKKLAKHVGNPRLKDNRVAWDENEKLLLFPGMKLPDAWVWKRDAQGLTRKATNWKAINYPTGMDFLAWQAIWGDAIL